jgi:hypothetical protein
MRKGYRRNRPQSRRGGFFGVILFLVLLLSLAWIWKADKVKEYYSTMKNLEDIKKSSITENSHLKSSLTELKSLTSVNKVITERFGLTQNVSARVFLQDPVRSAGHTGKFHLVDMQEVTDWLERAVFKSGHVTAEEQQNSKKERK